MDLPSVAMLEILSRLSIKSIFRCKTVCKLWYRLLTSDPLFVNMYHTRLSNFPSILLLINGSVQLLVELKADDSHPLHRAIVLSPEFHLPPLEHMSLIGSCNGFICLLNNYYTKNHSVYINNPLLGEYFKVKLPEWERNVCHVAYGFCFRKAFGQYKILRLVIRKFRWDLPKVAELEVYTVGVDKKWRNVGEVPCPDHLWESFDNVNVNGVVHWLENCTSIYSFNIGTEEVKPLPTPPGLKTASWYLTLAELGNCLCLSDNSHSQYVDIWRMKEYGVTESWTKYCILKDSIQLDIRNDRFDLGKW
ncbi:hypothetical protein BC332_27432 [Capsicum chinense]|nr:hypothetical protein BC332_27432 [Capsicum chinense]